MNIGQKVVELIVSQPLFGKECPAAPEAGCLAIWNGNAAEQLDALIEKHFYPDPPEAKRLWGNDAESVGTHGEATWRIRDLRAVVADEPVFDLPLAFFPFADHQFDAKDLYEFAQHMLHVMTADVDDPVIMDQRGRVCDGRHRIVKALLDGRRTIRCVKIPPGATPTA